MLRTVLFLLFFSGCVSARAAVSRPGLIPIGNISEEALAKPIADINAVVQTGAREVFLRFDSPGGSVFSGLRFLQRMEEHRKAGVRFTCVTDVMSASMGLVIFSQCDIRLATHRSIFLAHGASSSGQGTVERLSEAAQFLGVINQALAELVCSRLRISLPEYQRLTAGRDWVFGARTALEIGLVDSVVDPMEMPPLYVAPPVKASFLPMFLR